MLKQIALLMALFGASHAGAVQVVPSSYDMLNGIYLDDTYSGSGCKTCAGAALTNGLGDLTNGVAATSSWDVTPLPWVGWQNTAQTITFRFAQSSDIGSVTLRFDDSNTSGVNPPQSVTILGQTYAVADPVGKAPFDFVISNVAFSGVALPITITPRSGSFMMLSEVTFQSPVPEPATALSMMVGCLALVGFSRLRRRPGATFQG